MFLGKGVLKICSKFTGEHPCRSMISIKLRGKIRPKALKNMRRKKQGKEEKEESSPTIKSRQMKNMIWKK